MDSLTQVVLGGAVGYAVLGNKVGRKAAIYGAILGTLPDLDVFLPYGGEVEAFTYHRGFSHSILWRILVMSDGQYYEGYVSVFDSASDVSLDVYHSSDYLLENIKDEWGVQRLQWFTKGFYSVKQDEQNIVLSDLRMGVECGYVFNFIVGEQTSTGIVTRHYEKVTGRPDLSQLGRFWDRIFDPSVSLTSDKKKGVCITSENDAIG
jgi:hypothetical protein